MCELFFLFFFFFKYICACKKKKIRFVVAFLEVYYTSVIMSHHVHMGKGGREERSYSITALLFCSFTLDIKDTIQPSSSVPAVRRRGGQVESAALTTL